MAAPHVPIDVHQPPPKIGALGVIQVCKNEGWPDQQIFKSFAIQKSARINFISLCLLHDV